MEQFCQDKNNIAIVGGGPAGIFCAVSFAEGHLATTFMKWFLP